MILLQGWPDSLVIALQPQILSVVEGMEEGRTLMNEHPVINIKNTKTEWLHDIICLALFVSIIIYLAFAWPYLPDQIPIHYDALGNQWGSKWVTFLLIALTILIYIGFTILRKHPYKFNYPDRLTEENAERFYKNANLTISWMNFEIAIYFLWLSKGFIDSAVNQSDFMVLSELLIWISVLVVTMLYFLIRQSRIQ